jgi:ketosteroid isomerase-like protein
MSQENVEKTRRLWDDFQAGLAQGDALAWLDSDLVADDFEWCFELSLAVLEGGRTVWRGREGFAEFMRMWTEEFEDWSIRAEGWVAGTEGRVAAATHQAGTGRTSGVPVEGEMGQVWEWESGRLIRSRVFASHAEALEAAGLRE